jgi:hypothetical protein
MILSLSKVAAIEMVVEVSAAAGGGGIDDTIFFLALSRIFF